MKAGLGVEAAYRFVRNHIPFLEEDREMHLDMAKAEEIIASGELLTVVENAIGPLE
jgi:histidine ammonia-lyase